MVEKRPYCPACCRALSGQLVLSRCNHVFHRDCLPPVDGLCPKCHEPDAGQNALDIFGVSFKSKGDSGAHASAASSEISKVVSLRRDVEEQKAEVEALKTSLEQAKQYAEKQEQKLAVVKKSHAAKEEKLRAASSNLDSLRHKHEHLLDLMRRKREEVEFSEYIDSLASDGSSEEALERITLMIEMAIDPAPLLVEMARLREYYRTSTTKMQSQCTKLSQNESRDRREIVEKQRVLGELKRKLEKLER